MRATGYVRQSEIDRRNQNLGNRDTERDQQKWLGAEYAQLHRHSSLCFSALPFSTITLLNAISPVKLNQLVMTLILKSEVACDLLVCMLGPSSTTLRRQPTIDTVSNPSHEAKMLRKAGQSRWLGRRPVIRGVPMNPVDHPRGRGEGRGKSSGNHGRCSLTRWGKPSDQAAHVAPLSAAYTRLSVDPWIV
ncbi:Ribosomal L2 C domain-containing protein [Citrus sinensis]|nr:Ribosomal L2 C domain-containing protein [Citrus sinensis]